MDLNLLRNMMKEVRENKDFLDSMSPNQFLSKTALIKHITNLDILHKHSHIVIWGSWYGSILVPALYDKVGKITCIDLIQKRSASLNTEYFQNMMLNGSQMIYLPHGVIGTKM